ncbi:MAG TPA: hypothetical protein VJH37_01750 [Candidatus Nanoarchaeia archaeon]|nr:hypothetical protein [Candidatus Nanoarchaeia archaeon]
MKNNYKKICSKCGSINISVYTKSGLSFGEKLLEFCKDCNYGYITGGFFPEMNASAIKKFRETLKKEK